MQNPAWDVLPNHAILHYAVVQSTYHDTLAKSYCRERAIAASSPLQCGWCISRTKLTLKLTVVHFRFSTQIQFTQSNPLLHNSRVVDGDGPNFEGGRFDKGQWPTPIRTAIPLDLYGPNLVWNRFVREECYVHNPSGGPQEPIFIHCLPSYRLSSSHQILHGSTSADRFLCSTMPPISGGGARGSKFLGSLHTFT